MLTGMVGSADAPITLGQVGVLSESEHGDSFRMKATATDGLYCFILGKWLYLSLVLD